MYGNHSNLHPNHDPISQAMYTLCKAPVSTSKSHQGKEESQRWKTSTHGVRPLRSTPYVNQTLVGVMKPRIQETGHMLTIGLSREKKKKNTRVRTGNDSPLGLNYDKMANIRVSSDIEGGATVRIRTTQETGHPLTLGLSREKKKKYIRVAPRHEHCMGTTLWHSS